MERLISAAGLFVMMFLAWLLSNNKRKIDFRVIVSGVLLQFLFALIILKTDPGREFFELAHRGVNKLLSLSDAGAQFVFGEDYTKHFFAFKVLPAIIFVSSISGILFHWGVLQKLVKSIAWIMYKIMRISGAESLVTAANVFCGQTEAPFLVKPYINSMTRSEILCMMAGGMATVSGSILAAYVGMGISAGHLLSASLMSAPAAIVIAKIVFPETETSPTMGKPTLEFKSGAVNTFDAACRGAADGVKLAINVAAMLIAFIALVALANALLSLIGGWFGIELSVEMILGYVFSPLAFFMGVPFDECLQIGRLLGEKTVINEFLAFMHLGEMIAKGELSDRAVTIATYALCGFANFSSIAIQIGGIGELEPRRKGDFAKLGLRAMIAGSLAAFMTGCVAGVLL